jgi:hypothetical protein
MALCQEQFYKEGSGVLAYLMSDIWSLHHFGQIIL